MVRYETTGEYLPTKKFLREISDADFSTVLHKYGRRGVSALAAATPVDSGLTASSWTYDITSEPGLVTVTWRNLNIHDGYSIALLLAYGHGTRNGGWVAGRDYINPAIQPIFDKIADEAWSEVTNYGGN